MPRTSRNQALARLALVSALGVAAACDRDSGQANRASRDCVEWTAPYLAWFVPIFGSFDYSERWSEVPRWVVLGGDLLVPNPPPLSNPGRRATWADAVADILIGAVYRRLVAVGSQADHGGLGNCPAVGLHSDLAPDEVTVGAVLEAGMDGMIAIRITTVEPADTPLGGPEALQVATTPPSIYGGWLPLACDSAPERMEVLVRVPVAVLAGEGVDLALSSRVTRPLALGPSRWGGADPLRRPTATTSPALGD